MAPGRVRRRRGALDDDVHAGGAPGREGAPDRRLGAADLLAGRYLMLQKGRKSYALLVAEG